MKYKFIILIFIFFLVLPIVSSLEFDNVKSFDENIGKYGKITIKDWFGLLDLIELILEENTNTCYNSCSAETKIIMHQKGALIDNVRFMELQDDKSWNQTTIKKWKFYILDNGKKIPYTLGTKVEKGTYYVILEGEKNYLQTIDWQISTFGSWSSEWATWNGVGTLHTGLVAYYNMDAETDDLNSTVYGEMNMTNSTEGNPIYEALGIVNSAVAFDGDDDPMLAQDTGIMPIGNEDRSISVWVKFNGTGNDGVIGMGSSTTSRENFNLVTNTQKLHFRAYDDDGDIFSIAYTTQAWYHVVLRYKGSSRLLVTYVNGTNYVNRTLGGDLNTLDNLTIGRHTYQGDGELTGKLDEIGIWNKTLVTDEVEALWNEGNGLAYETPGTPAESFKTTLLLPANKSDFAVNSNHFHVEYGNFQGGVRLYNATYYIWFKNGTLWNSTTYDINSSNKTIQYFGGFSLNDYKWNVKGLSKNSTENAIIDWGDNNWTFSIGATVDNEDYPYYIYETDSYKFNSNITLIAGGDLFAASLVYNGTSYLATKKDLGSNKYSLTREIDIPLLVGSDTSQNLTFYWNFKFLTGGSIFRQNSSTRSHNVTQLIINKCNDDYIGMARFLNISVHNESNVGERLNGTLDAKFDSWMGSGTVKQNYSLDSSQAENNYTFCVNQNNTFNVSSVINVKSALTNERTFYFNKENYNNTVTNIDFLLQPTGTAVIIQVQDAGLNPLQNYFAKVYRFYPEGNVYRIIERARTDEYGQFIARLIEPNTVKYQFEFLDEDNNILKRTQDMTIACRTTICTLPFIIEDSADDFERFKNDTEYDWTFSFSNTTNIYTFTWNDISLKSVRSRLLVKKILWNATTIICNSSSTSVSGQLTCDVGGTRASYQAQVFRRLLNEDERRIGFLNNKIGDITSTFGKEGLIWSFFLLMTMISIGYWKPPVGIGLYLFGIILLGPVLGIMYLNPAILIAQFVLGIVAIWAFKG